MRIFILLSLLWTFQMSFGQNWSVTPLSPMPEPVTNNAVVEGFVDGKPYVYSFAGLDATKNYQGIHLRSYRYDVMEDEWETLPDLPDTLGKIAASASRVGDIIYIIGGYHVFANGSELSSDRVHRFDTKTNTYLSDGAPIPVPIDDQVQVVWRDSLIYVITGWSNTANVRNVQVYNPAEDTWSVGTMLPTSQAYRAFGASGAILGDTIYYYGGARSDLNNFPATDFLRFGKIDVNDPLSIEWGALLPGITPTDAYRTACTVVDGRIYWIGGSTISYNYDGLAYAGGAGVPPAAQFIFFNPTQEFLLDPEEALPMDLRGVAEIGPGQRILAGGMRMDQEVSDRTLLLEWQQHPPLSTTSITSSSVSLFPTPGDQRVTIQWDATEDTPTQLIIRSINGTVVETRSLRNASEQITLQTDDWASGIYFFEVQFKQHSWTSKWVKY